MKDVAEESESTPLMGGKSRVYHHDKDERSSASDAHSHTHSHTDIESSQNGVTAPAAPENIFKRTFRFIQAHDVLFTVVVLSSLALLWWPWTAARTAENAIIEETAHKPQLGSGWTSNAAPFSMMDPRALSLSSMDRYDGSHPGEIFGDLRQRNIALPTNSWFENLLLGHSNTLPTNKVFQVPYIIDTGARIPGVRTHPCHVMANSKMVMMNYELDNGATLGAVDTFDPQHTVHSQGSPSITKLAIELAWENKKTRSSMRAPIVRGSPYTSMLYFHATPRILFDRHLKNRILIDNDPSKVLQCGEKEGVYSTKAVRAEREIRVEIDTSDMTWLIFLSEPLEFICSNFNVDLDMQRRGIVLPPGVVSDKKSYFELQATTPMELGMVRIAMANNCTSGQNPEYCGPERRPRDQTEYENILRRHADVYPTAKADIEFSFPIATREEEELRLVFNWRPKLMSRLKSYSDLDKFDADEEFYSDPSVNELLIFALPHHQERMRPIFGSSNQVIDPGCMPTIHGMACPALGASWSLIEHLHRTSFYASNGIRKEMEEDVRRAAIADLAWRMPRNYMEGAGDTYFSGKMLARISRVLLVADQVGLKETQAFQDALSHLRSGVEIWLNGSAQSMFLYDNAWGGLVMCGCDYGYENGVGFCRNRWPNCPALVDQGHNFGGGFYNDHHFHFGYHIYAAAVLSKFDAVWGRNWHEHVLLLIRDIANPSNDDRFFPTWRHKDWYLGFSWASGVVTIQNQPYPNGRNQESVSESIAAYEAVALYGDVMSEIFFYSDREEDKILRENAFRIRDIGRLLMATEARSAKTYWQVRAPNTPGVSRIYPDVYEPKAVGMIWSMLVQLQTWFGSEEWKAYGIQLIPITVASEMRDDPHWIVEMLPYLEKSCFNDPICVKEGWSIVVYTSMATAGQWKEAWKKTLELPPIAFESAGGNGHSLTNTLWYIATRPDFVPEPSNNLVVQPMH